MVQPAQDWPDFTRAILLVGVDSSGNPVGVRVDLNGNLNAILKGAGPTGLQTIGVDADGRIEVFILDADSQWGQVLRVGNAELAARLGAPTAWDGRGQVLLLTDFSSGWPASLRATAGAGAATEISPDMWVHGGFSLKLTGGSDGAGYAAVSLRAGPNPASRFGLAVWFSCLATPDYLQLNITYQADNAGYRSRARIDFANGKLQVMDSAGVYQDIATVAPYANPDYFHVFKFVVDLSAGLYERVLLDDVEVDASAYAPVTLGPGSELLTASVYLYSTAGDNDYAFVDSMILTSMEPANSS